MFDNLYVTSRSYVYNIVTSRIFKVSSPLRKVLLNYTGESDLAEKDPSTYQKISSLLFQLNTARNSDKHAPHSLQALQLVVCTQCNLSCHYCYAHAGTYNCKQRLMDFATAKAALDIMFSEFNTIDNIVFFGGEPLLNLSLISQVCEYVTENYSDRFKAFEMMSNLYSLSNAAIELIKKYKIQVSTSIDGTESLNAYRHTPDGENSYSSVAKNIQKLYRASKQPEAIEVTMSDLHSKSGYDSERIIKELSSVFPVKKFTVNNVTDFDGRMSGHLYRLPDAQTGIDIDSFIETGICDVHINDFVAIITGKNNDLLLCSAGSGQLSIFPDGNIYPCHIYCLDPHKKFLMGNVNSFSKANFEKVENAIVSFNSKSSYPSCSACVAKGICTSCMGTCLVTNAPLPHDDAFCKDRQRYYFTLIEEYARLMDYPEKFARFKCRLKECSVGGINA